MIEQSVGAFSFREGGRTMLGIIPIPRMIIKSKFDPDEIQSVKLRDELKEFVRLSGADWDGDIIHYDGRTYYVNVQLDIVREVS